MKNIHCQRTTRIMISVSVYIADFIDRHILNTSMLFFLVTFGHYLCRYVLTLEGQVPIAPHHTFFHFFFNFNFYLFFFCFCLFFSKVQTPFRKWLVVNSSLGILLTHTTFKPLFFLSLVVFWYHKGGKKSLPHHTVSNRSSTYNHPTH